MILTVVRHGQTKENEQGIIQGQNDGTLSSLGVEQSNRVSSELAAGKFDSIISSDLGRCRELAKKIHVYHPSVPLLWSPALREINYAEYQGKPINDLDLSIFSGTILTQKVPGGESWADLSSRIRTFLNEIYAKYKSGSVLLVTHGGTIQAIRACLEPASLTELAEEPSIPNCAVRRLVMERPVSPADLK